MTNSQQGTTSSSKREQYMRGDLTFHEYYGLLVDHLGEQTLRQLLPVKHSPAEWRELIAADPHLNNVSLSRWDKMHGAVVRLVRQTGGTEKLRPINGSGGWSLSDSVCVLKETARRYANADR